MYLQENLKYLKHKKGDFPVTDLHTKKIITFPCDQHLSKKEMNYVVKCVNDFYKLNSTTIFYKYLLKIQEKRNLGFQEDFKFFKTHSGNFSINNKYGAIIIITIRCGPTS